MEERDDSSLGSRDYPVGAIPGMPAQQAAKEGMRTFSSGATRDSDDNKLDYEGFLSPLVLRRYAEYMHKHRIQPDGNLRASDNWQKGIPMDTYMKSLWRHFMDVWSCWRNGREGEAWEEALCAMLFNVQGLIFETLRACEIPVGQEVSPPGEMGNQKALGGASLLENETERTKGLADRPIGGGCESSYSFTGFVSHPQKGLKG